MWEQGRDALRDGRLMEAEYAFRAVLEQQPDNWKAMRDLAVVLRRLGQKEEARRLEARAATLAPPSEKPVRRSWLQRLGLAEFLLAVLNPASLGIMLFASMLLPVIPWIAAAYYRIWPNRSKTLGIGIIGWIFVKVRRGMTGPFFLGLTAGALWLAILGPYALTDTDLGLGLFTGFIAVFTALCALRIVTALGLRLRSLLQGS
jgi:tetratricopeptide (TPR) repeat protein